MASFGFAWSCLCGPGFGVGVVLFESCSFLGGVCLFVVSKNCGALGSNSLQAFLRRRISLTAGSNTSCTLREATGLRKLMGTTGQSSLNSSVLVDVCAATSAEQISSTMVCGSVVGSGGGGHFSILVNRTVLICSLDLNYIYTPLIILMIHKKKTDIIMINKMASLKSELSKTTGEVILVQTGLRSVVLRTKNGIEREYLDTRVRQPILGWDIAYDNNNRIVQRDAKNRLISKPQFKNPLPPYLQRAYTEILHARNIQDVSLACAVKPSTAWCYTTNLAEVFPEIAMHVQNTDYINRDIKKAYGILRNKKGTLRDLMERMGSIQFISNAFAHLRLLRVSETRLSII